MFASIKRLLLKSGILSVKMIRKHLLKKSSYMKRTALGYELEGLLIKSCEALRAFQKVLSRSNQNHILSNFLTLLFMTYIYVLRMANCSKLLILR